MAASVGNVACAFVHGLPVPTSQRVMVFESLGVDGYGSLGLGQEPGRFDLAVVGIGAKSSVLTWLASLAQQKGPPITIVTDSGISLLRATIQKIGTPKITAFATPAVPTGVRVEVPISGVFG